MNNSTSFYLLRVVVNDDLTIDPYVSLGKVSNLQGILVPAVEITTTPANPSTPVPSVSTPVSSNTSVR
jgi:hypothetical protein